MHRRLQVTGMQGMDYKVWPDAGCLYNDKIVLLRVSAQGCLLVGPPGTGKTLLGMPFPVCVLKVCMVLRESCSKQHDAPAAVSSS